jgi:hypothetical protein
MLHYVHELEHLCMMLKLADARFDHQVLRRIQLGEPYVGGHIICQDADLGQKGSRNCRSSGVHICAVEFVTYK